MKKIIKLFNDGNVCVVGMRGTGKDVLFGNVINRKKQLYVSNLNYDMGMRYIPYDYNLIKINNTYKNLNDGNINAYVWELPPGTDIYLSDVGVYFPSQYCNELNKLYSDMPIYQALSRQLARNNFHVNCQNLNRVWDKIREQSDTYIMCNWCKVLFGKIVIQKITIYDKYSSCVERVKPCRISVPLLADKITKQTARQYLDNWVNTHGSVKSRILIYLNKSKHDTYYFQKVFKTSNK